MLIRMLSNNAFLAGRVRPVSMLLAGLVLFGMPEMKMGPNQVSLQASGKGVYEGTGIIVRCSSGKRIWKAAVVLPGIGIAEFIFDVIY